MALPDIDSYESLAGNLNDYTDVVDPTTDLPSIASNVTRADVAGMTRVLERLYVKWSNDGVDGTVLDFDSVVGKQNELWPTITRLGLGRWRFTFPPSFNDLTGQPATWNFRHAVGDAHHDEPIHCQAKKISPNIVEMYMWNLASVATDAGGVELLLRVF